MATATSSPPAPMASMPMPPPVGVCESEPRERLPRHAEPLAVDLMTDPVPRTAEPDAVLRRDRLEISVVVGVLEALLEHVVIDVTHGALRLHAGHAHRLELEVCHRAGGVLREGLVDADADFASGNEFAGDEMVREDRVRETPAGHGRRSPPTSVSSRRYCGGHRSVAGAGDGPAPSASVADDATGPGGIRSGY